jgi:hypothetical protein
MEAHKGGKTMIYIPKLTIKDALKGLGDPFIKLDRPFTEDEISAAKDVTAEAPRLILYCTGRPLTLDEKHDIQNYLAGTHHIAKMPGKRGKKEIEEYPPAWVEANEMAKKKEVATNEDIRS